MKENVVVLRGHHLWVLYLVKYCNWCSFERLKKEQTENYNEEHAERTINVLSKIINDKPQVLLVNKMDDICSEDCPIYNRDKCQFRLRRLDRIYTEHYDLEIGKKYATEEIFRRLKKIGELSLF